MANEGARGEIDLPFNGRIYRITPNFKTIVQVEHATGDSYRTLIAELADGRVPLWKLAIITSMLIRSVDPKAAGADETGEIIMEDGGASLTMPLALFFGRAVRGNKEHAKEVAAQNSDRPPDDSPTS